MADLIEFIGNYLVVKDETHEVAVHKKDIITVERYQYRNSDEHVTKIILTNDRFIKVSLDNVYRHDDLLNWWSDGDLG